MWSGGIWILGTHEAGLKGRLEEDLAAVARLKVSQIVQWRRQRLADAAVLMESRPLNEAIRVWMEGDVAGRPIEEVFRIIKEETGRWRTR